MPHFADSPPDSPSLPPGRPSKTQVKAAMNELQALGKELTTLSKEQLLRMKLEDDLQEAVLEWQRIPRFEAKRRQLQYIGRLMRACDPEPIRAALAVARGESAGEIVRLHRLEQLREAFLEDESVLGKIAKSYPFADPAEFSRLRALRKNALKEREEGRPPKNFREIFKTLKGMDEARQTFDEKI